MLKGLHLEIFIQRIVREAVAVLLASSLFFCLAALGNAETIRLSEKDKEESLQGKPLTLEDCYVLALKQSETIAINSELINEAEAHFLQSLGTLLPNVSFEVNKNVKDLKDNASALYLGESSEQKFVFKQTLFSGFKEIAGMAGSKLEKSQRKNELIRAKQLLFTDVSDAFYLLMEVREDLKILQTIRQTLLGRIHDLEKRVRLGRSRKSEIVNTEAQLYSVSADIELAKSQEAVARQLLGFLTGRPIENIVDSENDILDSKSESDYLAMAELRPDVQALKLAWEVAKKKVIIARSDFYPTVTLESNFYSYRTTAPVDSKWDVLFKIGVPIFKGTQTFGAVKEAQAKARESELQFIRARRSAKLDIEDAYVRLKYIISRNKALRKVLLAYEMNYVLQKEDYQLSLINNIDVLIAIQTLEQARRNYRQTLLEISRLYWQLRVATGQIPSEE